ncbi:hypothetical protein Fmac_002226 [Flemingia macrophylla]|uniref:Uncharacterized protein n=1 Tax=Flemingia macrophylla TaxID=520843 RepID=A0ABD1NJY0_9FABA
MENIPIKHEKHDSEGKWYSKPGSFLEVEQNFNRIVTSRFLQVRDMCIFPGLKWIVENHEPIIRPLLAPEIFHRTILHLMTGDLSDTALLFQRFGAVNKNTKVDAHYAAENRLCFSCVNLAPTGSRWICGSWCVAVAGYSEPEPDLVYCVAESLVEETEFEDLKVWSAPDSYPWTCHIYQIKSDALHFIGLRQSKEDSDWKPKRVRDDPHFHCNHRSLNPLYEGVVVKYDAETIKDFLEMKLSNYVMDEEEEQSPETVSHLERLKKKKKNNHLHKQEEHWITTQVEKKIGHFLHFLPSKYIGLVVVLTGFKNIDHREAVNSIEILVLFLHFENSKCTVSVVVLPDNKVLGKYNKKVVGQSMILNTVGHLRKDYLQKVLTGERF